MDELDIIIPIIAAILGVAYPIILQTISTIDTRYNTSDITIFFKTEFEYNSFRFLLYLDLSALGLFLINILFGFLSSHFIELITLLLIVFTIALVFSFLFLIRKLMIYYSKEELIKRIIKLDKKAREKGEYKYFITLTDIFCWSIRNEIEKIPETLNKYFYSCFKNYSKKDETKSGGLKSNFILVYKALEKLSSKIKLQFRSQAKDSKTQEGYPAPYYSLVYRAMQELLLKNNQRFKNLEDAVIGGGWLLYNDKIADETYLFLWYNLLFAVKNENDDAVITYWKNAFQFFQYSLRKIEKVRDTEEFLKILNQDEIDRRENERTLFFEFHFALGGLLLYKKRYNCVKRIFDYTNSEPPNYPLFPINMSEIFRLYFYYKASWDRELTFISHRYPFPDMEGVRTDGKVRNWICKYLSCLFIRQYTLHEYYIYQKHVELPALPPKLSEMVVWLDYIEIFHESVELILSDSEMIKELGFGNINFEKIKEAGKLRPIEIFERTKENLEIEIAKSKYSQKLSTSKTEDFKTSSRKIIKMMFTQFKTLFNENRVIENFRVKQITGIEELFDRLAFCDDTDISYLGADEILGTSFNLNWQYNFSMILFRMRSKTYVLEEDDFFKGIDKLSLSKDDHLIISFGLNFKFFKRFKKIANLEADNYNKIPIFNYGSFDPTLNQSVIILKKSDLPSIDFIDISKEEKSKFGFDKPIEEEFKIYADIIDLNNKPELIDEYQQRKPNKEVSKSVLGIIDLFTEIRWKKDAEVIQIQMDSEFEQRGLRNSIDDIKKLT